MDAGDSAAWTAAIVAIVAALIAAASMSVAWRQARAAQRSADIAEKDLAESRRQTVAAEQAAAAATEQAVEARRQNEQQLQLAREEREAGNRRHQQEQAAKHVAAVHEALRAAEVLSEELRDNAEAVREYQKRSENSFAGPGFATSHVVQWEAAVNKIRVDKPPSSEVTAAIDAYNTVAAQAGQAIERAHELAQQRQLSGSGRQALVDMITRVGKEYELLKQACDRFFEAHGVDPHNLTAP